MKTYYERIRELREDHDLLQKEVAAKLGIRENVYQRYEYGERLIPIDKLVKLAELYNTTTDYILGLIDDRRPYPKKGAGSRSGLNASVNKTQSVSG